MIFTVLKAGKRSLEVALDKDMKILIVDDFSTMRRIIKNLLRDLGFTNTSEADDGQTALPMLQNGNFDFLVTDWNMPGMSGLQLLEIIKKDYVAPPPVVMMVTAYGDEENFNTAKALGADDFLTKPVDFKLLKEKLIQQI